MIGELPTTLTVNGKEFEILNTDFRNALLILQAFNDTELTDQEKAFIMLDAMIGIDNLEPSDYAEAQKQCCWYLDGGKQYKEHRQDTKLMDWEQDEQLIFSAVNHVANKELRTEKYVHWWTFLGFFNEIQDGLFSYVLMIREKKANGKKLTDSEKEYYKKHKDLIEFKKKETEEEKEYKQDILSKFKR